MTLRTLFARTLDVLAVVSLMLILAAGMTLNSISATPVLLIAVIIALMSLKIEMYVSRSRDDSNTEG